MFSISQRLGLVARPAFAAILPSSQVGAVGFDSIFTRELSHKTHQATSKRFKTRGGGAVVFKPAGRQHGMSKHSRGRNQDKGRSVVISRGEKGDLWKRVQGLQVDMAKGMHNPNVAVKNAVMFPFRSTTRDGQLTLQRAQEAIIKKQLEDLVPVKELRGFQNPTPKGKVQWRLASQ